MSFVVTLSRAEYRFPSQCHRIVNILRFECSTDVSSADGIVGILEFRPQFLSVLLQTNHKIYKMKWPVSFSKRILIQLNYLSFDWQFDFVSSSLNWSICNCTPIRSPFTSWIIHFNSNSLFNE